MSAIAPSERTIVVVDRRYEALARRQLADWRGIEIALQPANRGTALGILLPLSRLRRRDPEARVAVFPYDHHVPRPAPFVKGVRASLRSSGVALLGVVPDRPAEELGWIVPDVVLADGLERVKQVVEKPQRAVAEELLRRGALWNSFVVAGRLGELWTLVAAHLPFDAAAFEGAVSSAEIDDLYSCGRSADFSAAVLEKAVDLQVARVEGSGWTDWGTPQRVFESLDGTPALDVLLRWILDGQCRTRLRARLRDLVSS